jgi:phage terminase large subunit-like protein
MARKPAQTADHPHVAKADGYARDIQSGAIPACKWVKLACQRYEGDRKREKASDWPYKFSPDLAERVCRFIEYLPHTKGKWAGNRELIVLEPWQCFILVNVFGFIRKDNGKRRFREADIIVPRKNGKSALSAGVGLYMLAADKEHGAEVYSGATTEKQAWEVFRPAKLMAQGRADLRAQLGIEVNASNIHVLATSSRFEPLIGKPGDGGSPSCAIIDEFHEHETPDQVDTMLTGMGAREQPLLWIITTAGDNLAGPCYDKLITCRQILEQVIDDEEKFFIEYTIDEADDWTSEEALRKANPNIDVSVSGDFLLARQKEAIQNARDQGRFKTKHLNLWVQSRAAAFNLQKWNEGYDPTLQPEDFAGRRAWLGLDLASETDIAALELIVEDDDGGFVEFGRYYLPEDTVADPKNSHYQAWQETGEVIVTDGAMIDFARIKEDILGIAEMFPRVEVGFDPYQATYLVTQLMEHDITCIKFPQQVATMSPAMKRLDALMLSSQLRHRHGPKSPMTWMISNVVARVDAKDNIYPRKERPENKIDGPVSLIMAIGRSMSVVEDTPYGDGRDLLVLG